ncbi:MAG: XdhC family protein [Prolixibacteraceae bacterium]|nr:XdhC family protein [Prolixibacteraceae bacterium]
MNNIYLKIVAEIGSGKNVVLGTLIKTKGSTPQVPGSSAIFSSEGLKSGTMGGGVLEAEAQKLALKVAHTKTNMYQEFELNASINDKTGAICGGSAVFLLDADPARNLDAFLQLKKSLENHKQGILITQINLFEGGVIVNRSWFSEGEKIPCDFYAEYGLGCEEMAQILQQKKPGIIENQEKSRVLFVEPVYPEPHLIIVGAGHVGKALCHLAAFSGFNVTVIDNRPELATKERFPDAGGIVVSDFETCFEKVPVTLGSFIVIVTQGHREDAAALQGCIKSEAGYIGMIGSKRKIALIRENMISSGTCTDSEFNKVYAPVGLDINSVTVKEIAVSIVAQLICFKNQKPRKEIWCMVLAAGESKRMKQQKLLMPYDGKTIIETVVGKAKDSEADKVLVVTGSHSENVETRIKPYQIQCVENKEYQKGMFSSVLCGINAIPAKVNAVIVMLGDQPMIQTSVINSLIKEYHKKQRGIIIPVFLGQRGHPVLIDLKFRKEINNLTGNTGLRELMELNPDEIVELEVDSEEILRDLDTPEDYKKTIK